MYRILFITMLIMLSVSTNAKPNKIELTPDIKILVKDRVRETGMHSKMNKKIVKEDKYLAPGVPEYEGINTENIKRINEFSRTSPPQPKRYNR